MDATIKRKMFAHENMKNCSPKLLIIGPKLFLSVLQPAQNQPKSHILFHKNGSLRHFYIMTLHTSCWPTSGVRDVLDKNVYVIFKLVLFPNRSLVETNQIKNKPNVVSENEDFPTCLYSLNGLCSCWRYFCLYTFVLATL